MNKHLLWIASLALGFAACTDKDMAVEDPSQPVDQPTQQPTQQSNLTEVKLASFAGNQNRVIYEAGTRAEGDQELNLKPGELRLVATIDNPSLSDGFNFTQEVGGRLMSATCVYHDEANNTYYITYHMQGNNYNTTQDVETAGAIQSFTIEDDGTVNLGQGFRAANPNSEDFDFNHLYFDRTSQRILAVGHNVLNGNQKNTNAIVGVFNPSDGTYTYSTVKTSEKAYDEEGKSLGYKDAGDANYIIRPNDYFLQPSGWNFYLVATRKGLAVVRADEGNLFKPVLYNDEVNYFIPTPGSAKSILQGTAGSYFGLLYLAEDTSEKPESYETSSKANIAHFAINTTNNNLLRSLMVPTNAPFESPWIDIEPQLDPKFITTLSGQTELPAEISPIDGKNTLFALERFSDEEYYAALGRNGLYYHFRGNSTNKVIEGVKKFGDRPVNNVFADRQVTGENIDGSGHDGFLYVANGSKLTVFHRHTMEELASYNLPSKDKDGNPITGSANFITVTSAPVGENGLSERTIAVAYGQAGVKIFKFMPQVKTVWEKDIVSD